MNGIHRFLTSRLGALLFLLFVLIAGAWDRLWPALPSPFDPEIQIHALSFVVTAVHRISITLFDIWIMLVVITMVRRSIGDDIARVTRKTEESEDQK